MGMFDMIIADFRCPYCRYEVSKEEMDRIVEDMNTWQTKSTICNLDVYRVGDRVRFEDLKMKEGWIKIHHICPKCDKFIEAEIEIRNSRLNNKIAYIKKI